MTMWDRIRDGARGMQSRGSQGQSHGPGHAPGHGPGPGRGSGRGGGRALKSQLVSAFKTQLSAAKSELKSGAYRDASMAMCALVAAADGTVDASERAQMESLIVSNEVLQNFPADDLRRRFNKHVDALLSNPYGGRASVMEEITKARKKPAEARAVVQTGMVIAGADGYFAQSEAAAIQEACMALGLSPSEFGM